MDHPAIHHLSRADKTLGRLIAKVGPCTLKPSSRTAPFEALVKAVTFQQLNGTAAKTLEGLVPGTRAIVRMSDEEIAERLTRVRGVGPWTVDMLLMFTLGRRDVLPATDYGVRKGFALVYGWNDLPSPKELLDHGEPPGPGNEPGTARRR